MPFDDGTPLQVEETDDRQWRLLADLRYHAKHEDFVVPRDTLTDFASVPRLFTWLVPTSGTYTKAAVLHDFLCSTAPVPRNDADGIFRRAMGELGVATVRRYVMWGAVRFGGQLQGAKPGDVLGIMLLALLVLPVALVGALFVLMSLSFLWVVEVVVYLSLRALRRSPPKPVRFWWS